MSGIFISYRRGDQAGFAGRLADALASAFGADNVFRDIEDIRPGEDFVTAIQDQLRTVGVMLVMIGPAWLTASRNGVRRLDEPGDFVRLEIQAGLASGKPVIPLLVGGATMPAEADLPPALAGLARRQALVLSDSGWRGDVERLIANLRELLPDTAGGRPRDRRRWLIPAALAVVLVPGLFALWRLAPDRTAPTQRLAVRPPAVDLAGRWTARVKYDWGDQHDEVFEFKYLGERLHGTASYLTGRLTIEEAKLEGEWLRFTTRSQEMLGSDNPWKEVTHRYSGQITPQGIRFTLETGGGHTVHPPVEFIARRANP
jgi:hypothetical protein